MDRYHLGGHKFSTRGAPDALPPALFPLLAPGGVGGQPGGGGPFSLTPSSVTLARLSYGPCFNRRLFTPSHGSGFRSKEALDRLTQHAAAAAVAGATASGTQFPHYPGAGDWGQLHMDLERYTHRYQLSTPVNAASTPTGAASKGSGSSPDSPQAPEDLSTSLRDDRLQGEDLGPREPPTSEDEEEDADDGSEDEPKSPTVSTLKFSIEAILGGQCSRRSHLTDRPRGLLALAPPSPGRLPRGFSDPEDGGEDEGGPGDKALDGLLGDSGERFSWLQCTRYKPPKLPRTKKKDGAKKRKLGRNPRVPFTQHQVNILEQKFRQTHYLSSVDVAELSAALNLTETRVKIWFQNRRARERRDRENLQLLHGGEATKSKSPGGGGSERLSPDPAGPQHRSPRDTSPAALIPGRMDLGLGTLAGPHLTPGGWPAPLPPKPGVLGPFPGPHRTSAFTPVSYFSYT